MRERRKKFEALVRDEAQITNLTFIGVTEVKFVEKSTKVLVSYR